MPDARSLLSLCAATLMASVAGAQTPSGQVRGVVVDSAGAPLSAVAVVSAGTQSRGVTTERGQFLLTALAQGLHTIVAERAGFAPETSLVTLNEADTLDLRIVLLAITPKPVAVGKDEKNRPVHPFDRRLANKGGGRFITREQIEKRNPRYLSDMLRNFSGLRIIDSAGVTVAVSTRGPRHETRADGTTDASPCVLRVGLDGLPKDGWFDMDDVNPSAVYGIEVFAGAATIPAEYGGMRPEAWCGLIMIWTRYGS
jgi:hypothetical protein